jgi:hypothetical protein
MKKKCVIGGLQGYDENSTKRSGVYIQVVHGPPTCQDTQLGKRAGDTFHSSI